MYKLNISYFIRQFSHIDHLLVTKQQQKKNIFLHHKLQVPQLYFTGFLISSLANETYKYHTIG